MTTNLIAAVTFFVSTAGNDTNSGSIDAPIRHVQSALDRASYGDTVLIFPGLYREQVYLDGRYWPTNGATGSATNMLAVRAYGSGVIIQASERVTAWTPVNDPTEWGTISGEPFCSNCVFKTEWVVPSGEVVQLVMEAEDTPMLDSPFLKRHTYLYRCGWLYIWPEKAPFDGIEVGGGNSAFEEIYGSPFRMEGVDYVKVEGIHFRYSGTGYGGSGVALGRFCLVNNCKIDWMDFQGLSLWNGVVTNSTIVACGAKGLENAWSNAVVVDSIIGGNNWRNFGGDGQAAGIKIITRRVTDNMAYADISGTLLLRNWFPTNHADAIWIDTMIAQPDRPCIVASNLLTGNNGGIFLECSAGIQVISNTLTGNSEKGIKFRWGSSNTIAANTVIVGPGASIDTCPFHMAAEGDTAMGIRNAGNLIVSNRFSTALPQAVLSTGQDGPTPAAAYFDNIYAYNTVTNEAFRLQLNVWEYPYVGGPTPCFTIGDFETRANGGRVEYGWRKSNRNTGNH